MDVRKLMLMAGALVFAAICAVTARSMFRPRNVLVRATLPLIRRRFHRVQREILDGLGQYVCGLAVSRPSSRTTRG